MAFEFFSHGGVQYPLPASTANSLLQDADPSLFALLAHVADAIEYYVGPRLIAQAALEGLNFQAAVAQRLHVEPAPVLADQMKFPTLAIYRKRDVFSRKTVLNDTDASEWEVAYVMPPMGPRERQQLEPVLRSISVVIKHAVASKQLAGIAKARFIDSRYGGYENIQQIPQYYRAVFGTIEVTEQTTPDTRNSEEFDGVDGTIEQTELDGTKGANVVQVSTSSAPTIASITPDIGTKVGGTSVSIAGMGFVSTRPPTVQIGNAHASSVVVLSPTLLTCLTPPHAAYPTFVADVVVTNPDGQSAELEASFTFTSP